jgi:hypothetical protein
VGRIHSARDEQKKQHLLKVGSHVGIGVKIFFAIKILSAVKIFNNKNAIFCAKKILRYTKSICKLGYLREKNANNGCCYCRYCQGLLKG